MIRLVAGPWEILKQLIKKKENSAIDDLGGFFCRCKSMSSIVVNNVSYYVKSILLMINDILTAITHSSMRAEG